MESSAYLQNAQKSVRDEQLMISFLPLIVARASQQAARVRGSLYGAKSGSLGWQNLKTLLTGQY